jgi:maltooligosyltrehalose trehalohydrolase
VTRFELWAPHAHRVELVTGAQRIRLRRASGGWFRSELPLDGERDYGFALDGGETLPDPRSRWQPDGVFGLSRTMRAATFTAADSSFRPEPLARAVFYELHVGTFTPAGTFLSAIERLDHLVAL